MPERAMHEFFAHSAQLGRSLALDRPMVSLLMPTHGRAARQPDVIAEAVFWACSQTYSDTEVLILNDVPGQTIHIDSVKYPQVRIFNFPYRIASLGEKMNFLVLEAAGSICLPADDDDIALPWRAEQAVRMLAVYDYWVPGLWWYYGKQDDTMKADSNGYCPGVAYRRAALLNHYEACSHAVDAKMHGWATANLRVNPNRLTDPKDISLVYRWGVSDLHISGQPDMDVAFRNTPDGPLGNYEIKPAMFEDWVARHDAIAGSHPGSTIVPTTIIG